MRFLVVCPISVLESVWGEQLKKYSSFDYMNCHKEGLPDPKSEPVPTFMLINYESLRLDRNVTKLSALVYMLPVTAILDESSKIKAHDTVTTKTILRFAPHFKSRIIMSGTPTPNSELEWWAQMNFVKPWVLGSSFNQFKNSYFHWENRSGQAMNIPQGAFMTREVIAKLHKTGCQMSITPQMRKAMMEKISPFCNVVKKRDCLDLPDEIDLIREVSLTAAQKKAYHEMEEDLITQLGDLFEGEGYLSPIVAQNGLTKIAKLREITSGFAFNDKHEEVDLGHSPKLAELGLLADELAGKKLIIWANFRWEIKRIIEALEDIAPVSSINETTHDRNAEIQAFIKGDTRFFVANPQSAGHGIDGLQSVCSNEVFFSLSYSMEQYVQARGRIHRQGQTEPCVYTHLIARDTIDQEIYQVVKGKQTAQDVLLKMISRKVAA